MPNWVEILIKLRNTIVKIFGLKTEKPEDFNTTCIVGGYVGFFRFLVFKKMK